MLVLAILAFGPATRLPGAESDEETQLLSVLQSNASPQQKDAACARLKRVGTARSVSALAALLPDEDLSHSARYALESMPVPEAGQALMDALGKTSGLTKVGIVQSLGFRREAQSAPALAGLLSDADAAIVTAAATALGKIAGPVPLEALQSALPGARGPARAALVDGLLQCANKALANGDRDTAASVFEKLRGSEAQPHVRTAAYGGMIRAAGDRGLSLVIAGIRGDDGPSQLAALAMARDVRDPGATQAYVTLLPQVSAAVQMALIEVLDQRGDPAAGPAVLALAGSPDAGVRLAALGALGRLGDARAVRVLTEAAVSASEPEQQAARQSLLELRRGDVTEALLAQLASAQPAVQAEVVRALAGRAEKSTVPKLLELARGGAESARKASFQALAQLGDASHAASLVRLIVDAKAETDRSQARDALVAVSQRLDGEDVGRAAEPVAEALGGGSTEARVALLDVSSVLVDGRIRAAMRAAVNDSNPAIRLAGIRALSDTRDPELLPDLLVLARTATEPNARGLAIRGSVRLATAEETARFTPRQRVDALRQVLALADRAEQKRLVLAGLANVPDAEALELVMPLLDDPAVRAEAAQAATQIASGIMGAHVALANRALKKVLAVASDPSRRQAAESLLKQIEAMADFITAWQVAGPYRQEGKNYAALFDTVFPPESTEAKTVAWQLLPAGTDPARPWLLDLLKAFGGEQCVAYVRTHIHSVKEQPARLELGTDDGVKVWLNGKLVHAHNIARPIVVGSDKVDVTLQPGWNRLMLKITQNNLGWEYCARLVRPDGSRLEGLRLAGAPAE